MIVITNLNVSLNSIDLMNRNLQLLLVWFPIIILGTCIYSTFYDPRGSNFLGYELSDKIVERSRKLVALSDASNAVEILENSRKTLKRIPIDAEALIFSALGKKLQAPSERFDVNLLNEARRRNPRRRATSKSLLWLAQSTNDNSLAVREASLLYSLERKNRDPYFQVISSVYDKPGGSKIIDSYIQNNAYWSYKLLRAKIHDLDQNNVVKVKSSIEAYLGKRPSFDLERDFKEKSSLISYYAYRLIQIGQSSDALEIWTDNNDLEGNSPPNALKVFNPNFLKLAASAPFNWYLYNNDVVSSEYNREGGVFAAFRGKKPTVVARQYIPWQLTTNLTLKLDSIHKYNKNKGQFFIQIRCANSNTLITQFDINYTTKDRNLKVNDLNLNPYSCNSAYLEIKAMPGKYASPISITINSLELVSNRMVEE